MRQRAIDIALLVGLVLVAGAIVWTLFSLGRDPTPSPGPDAGPEIEAPLADADDGDDGDAPGDGGAGNGVVPVAPGGSAADADDEAGDAGAAGAGDDAAGDDGDGGAEDGDAGDDAGGADAAGADGAEDEAAGDDADGEVQADAPSVADRPDPDVPAADAPPLPDEGPVALGRVGFSYVTGGAGACGIVLEAWEHVAVSRELLEAYGCGAEVTITLDDETAGRETFDAVIGDTMNPAFSRTVNVYVGEDEPALEFGLTAGTLLAR